MRYNVNSGISVERNTSILAAVVAVASAGLIAMATLIQPASATTDTTVVTPTNLQGWTEYSGGADLEFVSDSTAPAGSGALQMSATEGSQYGMFWKDNSGSQVKASEVNVSYATKRLLGPDHAAPAYVLLVDKDGDPESLDGFYAIYEPVYNDNGSEDYDSWNTWDITAESKFWYTNAYGTKPDGAVNYTSLNSVLGEYPAATISAVVLNIGTGNADWKVLVDKVETTDGVYDFERYAVATGQILSPTSGEEVSGTLTLAATYNDGDEDNDDAVQWAVRKGTCSASTGTVAGNVDGKSDESSWNGTDFSASLNVSEYVPGDYCFVFNPTDEPGQNNVRETVEFKIITFAAVTKEDCKNNRWEIFGADYKNQGQCVASVTSNEKSKLNRQ